MGVRIGLDMTEIERIEAMMQKDGFLDRILGPEERRYYEEKGLKAESVAAAFCAKEAFSKALGTGVRGFLLKEVEVLHDALGRPYYSFSGAAAELVQKERLHFELSITHTKTTAAAVCAAVSEDTI